VSLPPSLAPGPPNRWPWLLAAGVAAVYVAVALRPGLLDLLAIPHLGIWFLDTYALLASCDALASGLDPYVPNPLDHLGRPHGYPSWWLYLGKLGLTRADHVWLGLAVVLAFSAVVAARLRPRSGGEALWYAAIWCSPPVIFALERANNDLVVFVLLAAVVPCVLAAGWGGRLLAILLIVIAAALKFYPLVALLLVIPGADRREIGRNALAAGLAVALVGADLLQELTRFQAVAPHPRGLVSFGATAFAPILEWSGRGPMCLVAAAGVALVAAWWRSRRFDGWLVAAEDQGAWYSFLLGAVLLTGCFFAGLNYTYRFVFALWLAPLLWRLARDPRATGPVRRLATLTAALLVAVLWITPVLYQVIKYLRPRFPQPVVKAWADGLLLAEQPLLWLFFACLLGFLTHFGRGLIRTLRGASASG
jgi:hypothetical protein